MDKAGNFETRDLMIGDFVICDDKVTRVIDISECPDRSCVLIVELDDSRDYLESEVSPVKLTDEIIEKNGLGKGHYIGNTSKSNFIFEILPGENTLVEYDETMSSVCVFHFRYVHELQNLLRIVGLTELADNFKI